MRFPIPELGGEQRGAGTVVGMSHRARVGPSPEDRDLPNMRPQPTGPPSGLLTGALHSAAVLALRLADPVRSPRRRAVTSMAQLMLTMRGDLPDLRRPMGSLHWSTPPMAAVCRLATPMRAVREVGDAQWRAST